MTAYYKTFSRAFDHLEIVAAFFSEGRQLLRLVSVVSYVMFVLSLFISYLSFFLCLGKTVFRDCGVTWVSSHTIARFALLFIIKTFLKSRLHHTRMCVTCE